MDRRTLDGLTPGRWMDVGWMDGWGEDGWTDDWRGDGWTMDGRVRGWVDGRRMAGGRRVDDGWLTCGCWVDDGRTTREREDGGWTH